MASVSNPPPEKKIESSWSCLCSPSPLTTRRSDVDSSGRALPDGAFMLYDLFSENECAALIHASEASAGFGYTNYAKDYRGNLRLTTTDHSLTATVWERLRLFLPETLSLVNDHGATEMWEVVGLNECWRLAKYFPSDRFKCHYDASFTRNCHEKSVFTVNVYMNGGFGGGRTRFFSKLHGGEEVAAIKGSPGACLVFMQPPGKLLAHDGEEVASGHKYLFRTDVMYRRVGAPEAHPAERIPEHVSDPVGEALFHEAECHEAAGNFNKAIAAYNKLRRLHPTVAEREKIM